MYAKTTFFHRGKYYKKDAELPEHIKGKELESLLEQDLVTDADPDAEDEAPEPLAAKKPRRKGKTESDVEEPDPNAKPAAG